VSNEIYFNGCRFISVSETARIASVTRDYIGRLCRDGKLSGKRIGKLWYVEEDSLNRFLIEKEYSNVSRREALSKERVEEYKSHSKGPGAKTNKNKTQEDVPVISVPAFSTPRVSQKRYLRPEISNVSKRTSRVKEMIERGVHTMNDTTKQASAHAVGTLVHTAPVQHIADIGQRITALFIAFVLVFGMYGFVDAQYTRFTKETIATSFKYTKDAPQKIAHAFQNADLGTAVNQFASVSAAAANNPAAAALSFGERFSKNVGTVAKSVNDYVDTFVYEIVFTPEVRFAIGTVSGPQRNASVEVSVVPYSGDTSGNTNTKITQTTQPTGPTTIIQQPVVERVLTTERVVTQGGISESDLIFRLNTLDNKLTSQIYAVSASIPSFSGPAQTTVVTTQSFAHSNKIDQLGGVDITGGTISGATITGGSVTATSFSGTLGIGSGGTGTSTAPSYGQVLLGQSDGTYDLVATSSLGISGGSSEWTDSGFYLQTGESSEAVVIGTTTVPVLTSLLVTSTSTDTTTVLDVQDSTGTSRLSVSGSGFGTTTVTGLTISGSATSTSNVGINLTGGCFSVNGTCISGSGGGGSGDPFAWTSTTYGNATSTTLGFLSGFISTASSTISDLHVTNSTTTSATTTNFAISNLANALLSTNANGSVIATSTIGLNLIPDNFLRNDEDDTTTGLLTIQGGLLSQASSTIGSGTEAGGLTISGTATTTNLRVTALTSGRVPYLTTNSQFTDSANLTFDGTTLTANTLALTTDLSVANGGTGASTLTGLLQGNGTSAITGITGTAGQLPYYNGTDTLLATSTIFLSTASQVGIGTTTPYSKLTTWGTGSLFEAVTNASSTVFSIGQSGATTTNFAISNIASSLLKTNSNGSIIAAVAGTDYTNFGYLFPSNATSTTLTFTGGLLSQASSTIGSGTEAGGLTISGTATTTNLRVTALTSGRVPYLTTNSQFTDSANLTFDGTTLTANTLALTTDLSVANGGTGASTLTGLLQGNGTSAITGITGTAGQLPYYNGTDTLLATSTIFLSTASQVGIGTTTPYSKLTTWGTGSLFEAVTNASSTVFSIGQSGATTTNFAISNIASSLLKTNSNGSIIAAVAGTDYTNFGYLFPNNATTTGLGIYASSTIGAGGQTTGLTISGGATTTGYFLAQNTTDSTTGFQILDADGGTPIFNVDTTNERVGIGTTSPDSVFHVESETAPTLSIGPGTNTSVDPTLFLTDTGSSAGFKLWYDNDAGDTYFDNLWDNADAGMFFRTRVDGTDVDALTILGDGNVGIGTTTPTSLLQLAGASAPKFTISDTDASANQKHFFLQSDSGTFSIGTTSDSLVDTATFPLSISSTGFGTTTLSGLNITGSATSTSDVGFNITTGCFAIDGTCVGGGSGSGTVNSGTTGQLPYYAADGETLTATSTIFLATSGNVGIGTSSPYSKLTAWGGSTGNIFEAVTNASSTALVVNVSGNVGVGTTSPWRKLSVTDTVSAAQAVIAYDSTRYASLQVNSVGDLIIDPSGDDAFFNDDNLWVCTGGSCPSGTPSGTGNLIVESSVGVASSTPFAKLSIGADGAITTVEKDLTDQATISVSWLDGNQQRVVLGGNRTINFSNYIEGQVLRLVVCQDGTGSRTVTWDSNISWNGGTEPTLTTTISRCDVLSFIATAGASGGTDVYGTATLDFAD